MWPCGEPGEAEIEKKRETGGGKVGLQQSSLQAFETDKSFLGNNNVC